MAIGGRVEEIQQNKAIEVKKEKDHIFKASIPKFNLSELIITKSTLDQINRALAFQKHSDLVFEQWGLSKTHKYSKKVCLNFYGPPGTGKTMAAHAIANKLNKNLLIVNYAEIESKYVGETPKNLVSVFKNADEEDLVLFFDEADAMLSRRVTNMSSSTDTSVNQTRSVLLNILNDYEKPVLFATNFIENFDPAFMRRILAHIHFDLPDIDCRKRLYKMYTPENLPNDFDFDVLSEVSKGLSAADISNSVLLAAFSAAENEQKFLSMTNILDAIESITRSKNKNSFGEEQVGASLPSQSTSTSLSGNLN